MDLIRIILDIISEKGTFFDKAFDFLLQENPVFSILKCIKIRTSVFLKTGGTVKCHVPGFFAHSSVKRKSFFCGLEKTSPRRKNDKEVVI